MRQFEQNIKQQWQIFKRGNIQNEYVKALKYNLVQIQFQSKFQSLILAKFFKIKIRSQKSKDYDTSREPNIVVKKYGVLFSDDFRIIDININLNMSSNLEIKRQKIHKALRKEQINNKIKLFRERLKSIQETTNPLNETRIENTINQAIELSEYELRQMIGVLQEHGNHPKACLQFLQNINRFSSQSLAKPQLFDYMWRIFTNLEGRQNEFNDEISNLIKNICLRIIEKRDCSGTHDWLQRCYKQILLMARHSSTKMKQLWPALALVRSQEYYQQSLNIYFSFLQQFSECNTNQFNLILQTFTNFTTVIQGSKLTFLEVADIIKIMENINIICQNSDLAPQLIGLIAKICNNLFTIKQHFQCIIGQLTDYKNKIIYCLLEYLSKWNETDQNLFVITNILNLIATVFSNSSQNSQKINDKDPRIVQILVSLLPIKLPIAQYGQLRLKFHQVTLCVFSCLCNMAACQKLINILNRFQVTQLVMQLGLNLNYSNHSVRSEVSIFLFNFTLVCKPQAILSQCKNGLIKCLCYIINSDDSVEVLKMSLNTLWRVLKASSQFPNKNQQLNYHIEQLANECRKYEVLNRLQYFLYVSSMTISFLAQKCLNLIYMKNQQEIL